MNRFLVEIIKIILKILKCALLLIFWKDIFLFQIDS